MRTAALFIFVLVTLFAGRAGAARPAVELQRGDVRLHLVPERGVALTFRGVPVIVRSTATLVTPDWRQILYDASKAHPSVREWSEGDVQLAEIQGESEALAATYRLRLDADG